MAKVTLTDLTSLANDTSATNSINTNFQTLEDYINNNVLSRNTGAETNTMMNNLDLNSYNIVNGGNGIFSTITLDGVQMSTTAYADIGNIPVDWTVGQTGSTQVNTTATGNVTLDFSAYNNFILTLTGNLILDNPTTETVGQSGFIVFKQDATGSRTLTLGDQFLNVSGVAPTLSTAANAIDLIGYCVAGDGQILLGATLTEFS